MFSNVDGVLDYARQANIRLDLVDFLEHTAARKVPPPLCTVTCISPHELVLSGCILCFIQLEEQSSATVHCWGRSVLGG